MNYIRGVASAISAPYQYYKELPPINPSTLTGAIDVIVIRRPGPDGETELACSPFHVRFGKWQVLRPSEKKVNVSVNGQPIPYNMKIGEAGEAFFVFETDDDVPADLITSPILQPTSPEDIPDKATDRFGAKPDSDEEEETGEDSEDVEARLKERETANQEPDYLDLNANSDDFTHDGRKSDEPDMKGKLVDKGMTPKQAHHVPSFLQRSDSRVTLNQKNYLAPPSLPRVDSASGERTPEMEYQDRRVDEALKVLSSEGRIPEVEYHSDVALDMDGYHAKHQRDRSDRTIRSSEVDYFKLPRSKLSSTNLKPQTPSPDSSQSPSPSPTEPPNTSRLKPSTGGSHLPFPVFRATSEPPPDVMESTDIQTSEMGPSSVVGGSNPTTSAGSQDRSGSPTAHTGLREYSWEWGAFPQPSPLKTTFSKSGRMEGPSFNIGGVPPSPGARGASKGYHRRAKTVQIKNGRLGGMELPVLQDSDEEVDEDDEPVTFRGRSLAEKDHGRSHSVPAGVKGLSERPRKRRQWKEYEDYEDEADEEEFRGSNDAQTQGGAKEDGEYGMGGALNATKRDPTKFILSIEGRRVGFQISVIPVDVVPAKDEEDVRQEVYLFFKKKEAVETAEVFQRGIVEFEAFLADERIVSNPRLVIRWIGVEQYVTRQDGSPLMDSLVHWRQAAIQRRASGQNERPISPSSDDSRPVSPRVEIDSEASGDEGQEKAQLESSNEQVQSDGTAGNKPTSRSWVQWWRRSRQEDAASRPPMPATKSSPPPSTKALDKEEETDRQLVEPVKKKKFAKTLRLTSDQLKALDLQSGANSITFSLSASGAIAATARIFVWDHTDLILVSDIDGTITKSDGLGHVFAMLGRDWTHSGVAKLYTDITRNGYKIMYLTSRAIGQADATRGYLKGIKQNNYQLPEGPVIMSPDRLMASLHREVIMRKPEVFKMACLRDIQRLFGEHAKYPFYAGFGNRITDALSYRSVNIPSARIFTIDSAGEVKMELLELAGYKSSYIHMTDLVDQMFPPIHRKWAPEFTDFNYWRAPVQEFPLPDLSPPSPALSARSDTTLARIRNFSLVGSRQPTRENSSVNNNDNSPYRSSTLRQISSFERLSSTLGFSSSPNEEERSTSPDPFTSDDEEGDNLSESGRKKRERRRSITSMPGSLHEDDMGLDDDDGEGDYDDEQHEEEGDSPHPEEHAEDTFDDDLLAAGEMQNVPFL